MPGQPPTGIFITGTDTGVGKTHIGVALVQALREQGVNVQARKPVESGCDYIDGQRRPPDGLRYYHATAARDPLDIITPYRFEAALAPPQAAALQNRRISIEQLRNAVKRNLDDNSFCIVEGAGGFYSPLADDGLNADLAKQLGYPLLVVAANRLGCINHVLLTLEAAQQRGLEVSAVVLNQITQADASVALNADSLRSRLSMPIVSVGLNQLDKNVSAAPMHELARLLLKH